jgi:MscS family membrane protein
MLSETPASFGKTNEKDSLFPERKFSCTFLGKKSFQTFPPFPSSCYNEKVIKPLFRENPRAGKRDGALFRQEEERISEAFTCMERRIIPLQKSIEERERMISLKISRKSFLLLGTIGLVLALSSAAAFVSMASSADRSSSDRLRLAWGNLTTLDASEALAPTDRSSPRALIRSFVNNMNYGYRYLQDAKGLTAATPGLFYVPPQARNDAGRALFHFERAIHCLDLSGIPTSLRLQRAREYILFFKEVLDRVGLLPYDMIPDAEEVDKKGLTLWNIPRTPFQLHKVDTPGMDYGTWKLSPSSVAALRRSYTRVQNLPYLADATRDAYKSYIATPGAFFPPKWSFFIPSWAKRELFGQSLWQWLILIPSLLLFVFFLVGTWRFCRFLSKGGRGVFAEFLRIAPALVLTLGSHFMIYLMNAQINISGSFYTLLITLFSALLWIGGAWIVMRVGELLSALILLSPRLEEGSVDASLIRTTNRLLSISAGMGILLYGASHLGVSLVTLLTGFGVIGLAVSLAAKPTLENIIGGITLFVDRSVKVGEFCRFGSNAGTVLNIGLRTTKIQAMDQTIISIPNAEFSQMQITNVTRRNRSLMQKTINLRYETSHDQLRWILANLRELLYAHPKVYGEPVPFARFEGYGESSLDILIFAYIKTTRWAELMAIQEDILFRVGEIVEKGGSGFAFPSTTAYITRDEGLDSEKGAMAAKEVEAWRREDLYPFPDTPARRVEALRGSLEYPPKA